MITVVRDDPTVMVLSQSTGAMSDAAKAWSNAFVAPGGQTIPDSLRAAMKAAADQATAYQLWSNHFNLNWVIARNHAVPQPTTVPTPNAISAMSLAVLTASPAATVTNAAPAPAAASWFEGKTELFGKQIPNVALLAGAGVAALLLFGGGARGRR